MRNARSVRTGDAPRAAGATIGRVGPFLEAAACQPRSYAAGAAGRRRRTRGRDAAGLLELTWLELTWPGQTWRRATMRHGPTRRKPSSRAPRPRRSKRRGKGQRLPACPADAQHAPTGSAGAWRVGETKACDQVPRGGRGFEGAGGPGGGAGLGRARGRRGPGGGGGGGAPDGRAATAASSAVLAGAALGRPEAGWQGRMRLPARRSSRACLPRSGSSGHGKSGPRKRRKFSRRRR